MRKILEYVAIVFGVIAPTFELVTRICANLFFDPLPTYIHIVAFYLLSASLLAAVLLISKPFTPGRNRLAILSISYALVISVAYSIWFLPISWICALGILAVGIGLPGLAPFFLFAATLSIFGRWRSWLPADIAKACKARVALSMLLVIPALVIFWWNPIVIKIGESLLHSDSASSKYTGLSILDNFVSKKELQWRSFEVNTWFFGGQVYDYKALSNAFYYVYGYRPGIAKEENGFLGTREWEFDEDRGSSSVGRRQSGVKLSESALDGMVRTSEGYGYYEWTMVFANSTQFGKEARAAVQLPAYSVVSKASLWVDGEEREAAFGATSRVRSVYRQIVSYRRDPLLVTMIGPDQVQVQCFPVPANGSMKIRIGITCPLLEGQKLQLPHFIETNFDVPDDLQHKVWVEGDAPARVSLAGEVSENPVTVLSMTDEQLSRPDTHFDFEVTPPDRYSLDDGAITLRKIQEGTSGVSPVLLIDGRKDLFTKLKSVKWSGKKFSEVLVAEPFGYTAWDKKENLAQFLNEESTYGGVNPCPALLQSIRLAGNSNAPIVWIHGSLPSAVRDELGLEQIFRRSDHPVKIVTLAATGELNSMISDLSYMRYFSPQASSGDFGRDFVSAIESAEQLTKVSDGSVPLGGRTTSGFEFMADNPTAVSHPYRLYLYSQIMQSWNAKGSVPDDLITKALETHLVTPVTGAVVLENAEQFAAANLDPSVGVENVPKIPEPEFYILLLVAVLTMAIWYWRKRVTACRVSP